MKTYNFVYKTTFSDGRYYIGQHKTDNLKDKYFGSSRVVKDLVKQGNKPNREILRYCDTQKELNYWEQYYIGDNWKNDSLCLNGSCVCTIREEGNPWNKGKTSWNKGKKQSDEVKKKIAESLKGKFKGENHPCYGKKHTDETRRKMSESLKGRKPWNKGQKGKHRVYDNPEHTKWHIE